MTAHESGRGEEAENSRPQDDPVLPSGSRDDLDTGWGERPDDGDPLDFYLRERPPHHGD